mmetsp:Transcript_22279/g.56293  ORF Transcript_22279/g.56293 Transcript_22279/m.56293 type:complete len:215 (-) Transcript_22279:595-1239(-)
MVPEVEGKVGLHQRQNEHGVVKPQVPRTRQLEVAKVVFAEQRSHSVVLDQVLLVSELHLGHGAARKSGPGQLTRVASRVGSGEKPDIDPLVHAGRECSVRSSRAVQRRRPEGAALRFRVEEKVHELEQVAVGAVDHWLVPRVSALHVVLDRVPGGHSVEFALEILDERRVRFVPCHLVEFLPGTAEARNSARLNHVGLSVREVQSPAFAPFFGG